VAALLSLEHIDKQSALVFKATTGGNSEMIKCVIHCYLLGTSTLHYICRLLITHGCNPSETLDGFTPVQEACKRGRHRCLDILVAQGGDIRAHSLDTEAPCIIAARSGFTHCLRALMKSPHFDPNQTSKLGFTPLKYGVMYGHMTFVEVLLTHPQLNLHKKGIHQQ